MTVIKIKNSSVSGKLPADGDLVNGELAINLADKKLYSKGPDGIFEIGAAGDLPSGETPPSSGNNVGDLFYNTKPGEEGLYYWDGSSWILLSSEPADGEGYVKISGDNMTGALTIGPADPAEDRVTTLADDGSATFAGNVERSTYSSGQGWKIGKNTLTYKYPIGQVKTASFAVELDGSRNVEIFSDGSATFADNVSTKKNFLAQGIDGSGTLANKVVIDGNESSNTYGQITVFGSGGAGPADGCFRVYKRDAGQNTVQINHDGSATFAKSLTVSPNNGSTITNLTSQAGGVGFEGIGLSDSNQPSVLRWWGDNSSENALFSVNVGNDEVGYASRIADGMKIWSGVAGNKWKLNADGSATFAAEVKKDTFDNTSDSGYGWRLSSGAEYGQIDIDCTLTVSNTLEVFRVYKGTDPTIKFFPDGSATFAGTVEAAGGFTINGNPVTLSIAEADKLRETFQELQVAVANATDFAGLKAAMLVALEDYA